MAISIPPVPYKVQMLNESGLLTEAWAAWFRQMTAGVENDEDAPSNADLQDDIDDLSDTVSDLQSQINDLKQGPVL